MRLLIILLCLGTVVSAATLQCDLSANILFPQKQITAAIADKVYLCKSATAYVYHQTTRCRGLAACTHKIIEVTTEEAVNEYRRRACKVCY